MVILSYLFFAKLVALHYWRDIGVLRQSISARWPCHFNTSQPFRAGFKVQEEGLGHCSLSPIKKNESEFYKCKRDKYCIKCMQSI